MIPRIPFRVLAPLALTLLAVPAPGHAANGRWTSIGPYGGSVSAIAVAPGARRIVYAGSSDGLVFKSTDAGARWTYVGHGLFPAGRISALAVDPRDPDIVYAGVSGAPAVFKTTDGGLNWRPANEGLDSRNVLALALDPREPSVLFAATQGGLFRSGDGAATWRLSLGFSPDEDLFHSVAFDPSSPGTVYATGYQRGVFKSLDGGATWMSKNRGLPDGAGVIRLALAPSVPGLLFLTLTSDFPARLYRSDDGGESWSPSDQGIGDRGISALAVSPSSSTVYAGTGDGIFRSVDGGRTWLPPSSGGEVGAVWFLTVPPSPDGTVYAGLYDRGILKSTNHGSSWRLANRGLTAVPVRSLAVAPSNPSVLYVSVHGLGSRGPAVLRTTDGGATWQEAGQGLPPGEGPGLLAVNPRDPLQVIAAGFFGRVWKTADGGETWTLENGGVTYCMHPWDLEIDPADPRNVYLVGYESAVCEPPSREGCTGLRSVDGGESWRCMAVRASDLAVDPRRPSVLYAAGFSGALKSTDAGSVWRPVSGLSTEQFFDAVSLSPFSPSRVYLAGYSGLLKSSNAGRSWRPAERGLPPGTRVQELVASPAAASTVYAGGFVRFSGHSYHAVFESTDAGASWRTLSLAGFSPGIGWSLQAHPRRTGILWTATPLGVFRFTGPSPDR
ncbi:MAG TPA: hypothetical protein VF756_14530 [Thermoanaerobaculia bacterium]